MINFTSSTKYFLKSTPTDMRKGYEGLASIVREVMEHNPRNYNETFVFYSKGRYLCAAHFSSEAQSNV